MGSRKPALAALSALAVVVAVLCVFAFRGTSTAPAEAGTPRPTATTATPSAATPTPKPSTDAAQCANVRAHIERAGLVEKGDGPRDVAVIGDSYTAGLGLTDAKESWAHLAAGRLSGIGGTGFVNGGPCGDQTFGSRAADVLATKPRVLIVQGGLNDTTASPGQVTAAAQQLLDEARDVPIVLVVGPPDVPARTGEDRVDAALAKAAASRGRDYVSMLDLDPPLLKDRLHMTAEGHQAFADRVSAQVSG